MIINTMRPKELGMRRMFYVFPVVSVTREYEKYMTTDPDDEDYHEAPGNRYLYVGWLCYITCFNLTTGRFV